jgi:hypothetical protein
MMLPQKVSDVSRAVEGDDYLNCFRSLKKEGKIHKAYATNYHFEYLNGEMSKNNHRYEGFKLWQ